MVGNWKKLLRRNATVGAGLGVILISLSVLGLLPLGNLAPVSSTAINIDLTGAKKLYGGQEHPSFHLALSRQVGVWPAVAYADSEPQATVTYNGHQVAASADVTPQGDGFDITVVPQVQPKPGAYELTVSGSDRAGKFHKTTTFAWGVLAVNPTKSIYLPGETAEIDMAALSSTGKTMCTAPLQLQVTNPAGKTVDLPIKNSTQCQGDKYSDVPDYTSSYQVGGVGTYKITLGIKDTAYQISTTFAVRSSVPFDITRQAATRVVPTHPYFNQLTITAHQDFKGQVQERLTDHRFKINDAGGGSMTQDGNSQVLTWQVDWKAGQNYELHYDYLPPQVSPAFYQFAPLTLKSGNSTVFRESRGWELAGDAAITLVKETHSVVNTAVTSTVFSVTSTAGNSLILLYASSLTGATNGIGSITDTGSNTWTFAAPSSNDPVANFVAGTASEIAIAYVTNAANITSMTVANKSGTSGKVALDLMEFSGIDTANPDDTALSAGQATATTHTTPSLNLTLCDQPTTDQLLRGGDYFCAPTTEVVIALIDCGSATPTIDATSSAYNATLSMIVGANAVSAGGAYQIISTSGSYSVEFDLSATKAAGIGIQAFRQDTTGDNEQSLFWAQ